MAQALASFSTVAFVPKFALLQSFIDRCLRTFLFLQGLFVERGNPEAYKKVYLLFELQVL